MPPTIYYPGEQGGSCQNPLVQKGKLGLKGLKHFTQALRIHSECAEFRFKPRCLDLMPGLLTIPLHKICWSMAPPSRAQSLSGDMGMLMNNNDSIWKHQQRHTWATVVAPGGDVYFWRTDGRWAMVGYLHQGRRNHFNSFLKESDCSRERRGAL